MKWGKLASKVKKPRPAVIQGSKKAPVMTTPTKSPGGWIGVGGSGSGQAGSGSGRAGSKQVHEKLTQQHEAMQEVLNTVVYQQKQLQALGQVHLAHTEEMQAKMEALMAVQEKTKQELVESNHEVRAMAMRVVALEGKLDMAIALLELERRD
jgi:hypothetical protein